MNQQILVGNLIGNGEGASHNNHILPLATKAKGGTAFSHRHLKRGHAGRCLPAMNFAVNLDFQNARLGEEAKQEFHLGALHIERWYTLSVGKMAKLPVPLSHLAEQHQIVAEVEARTTAIDHLEAELDRQITRSHRLRQSVLAEAFRGGLSASQS